MSASGAGVVGIPVTRPAVRAHTTAAFRVGMIGLALALVPLLTGCSASEPFTAPTPPASVAAACDRVMAALPTTVAGQGASTPAGRYWRSWGDPAITLRCGVNRPEDLSPTSRCDVVNDVGWFSVDGPKGYRFTTIGRAGFIDVVVPHDYAPEADALVDLSAAVSLLPVVKPCQ